MAGEHGYSEYVYPAGCGSVGHLIVVHSHDLLRKEMEKNNGGEVLSIGAKPILMGTNRRVMWAKVGEDSTIGQSRSSRCTNSLLSYSRAYMLGSNFSEMIDSGLLIRVKLSTGVLMISFLILFEASLIRPSFCSITKTTPLHPTSINQ